MGSTWLPDDPSCSRDNLKGAHGFAQAVRTHLFINTISPYFCIRPSQTCVQGRSDLLSMAFDTEIMNTRRASSLAKEAYLKILISAVKGQQCVLWDFLLNGTNAHAYLCIGQVFMLTIRNVNPAILLSIPRDISLSAANHFAWKYPCNYAQPIRVWSINELFILVNWFILSQRLIIRVFAAGREAILR